MNNSLLKLNFENASNLSIQGVKSEDYFKEIYANPALVVLTIVSYIISLLGTFGLAFIVWFERSGQAGQYRTLVNQLVSFMMDMVSNF